MIKTVLPLKQAATESAGRSSKSGGCPSAAHFALLNTSLPRDEQDGDVCESCELLS